MQHASMDEAIRAYNPLVLPLSEKHADPDWTWSGAERDDLIQEGRIAVWLALKNGGYPSALVVEGAMLDWCRKLARQRRGEVGLDAPVSTEDEEPTTYVDVASHQEWMHGEFAE